MEDMLIGVADRTIPIFIPDPASTTGAGKTGLAAAAVTVTYTRIETDNDVVHTDVTSSVNDLSALTDAHNDWGWKEVSSTLSKGLYRLDIADAVFASGAWYAVVQVTITSGTAAATPKAFRLIARNDLTDISQTGDGYPIVSSGTHGNAALYALLNTELADVLAAVDTEVAAIKAVTDLLVAAHAEPTGVPAANATPLNKIGFLFAALRNQVTVTSTKMKFFDDAGAALWEKDLTDDGTTYTETEGNAP